MKKALLSLLLLSLFLLSGCVSQTGGENAYDVYFLTRESGQEAALAAERRTLSPEEDVVEGLLNSLLSGPSEEGLLRTIPDGVTLGGWTLENGLLTVDFSSRYGSLSGIALTLADYSVVLTLTQLNTVDTVMITAEGDLLSYRDHQRLTAADVQSELLPLVENQK